MGKKSATEGALLCRSFEKRFGSDGIAVPGALCGALYHPVVTQSFPLTRDEALARWRAFLPHVPAYAAGRNYVTMAPQRHVSGLSPAVRLGLITPQEIVRDTLEEHGYQPAEKWLQEVCWRTYWKGWLQQRPQIWRAWRQRVHALRETLPDAVKQRMEAVSAGHSGVAVMDHFARELAETGYLHNHARMWWASFWIHAERLPWELGADFFFQHLLDADPASNTLSWRWVAGLQTAGKTYLVRRGNLERFCEPALLQDTRGLERLEDGCVTAAIPREDLDMSPHALPDLPDRAPEVTGRFGLWMHADDLCLESSPLRSLRPAGIIAITSQPAYDHYRLSPQRISSLHAALQDGAGRASAHFRCPAGVLEAADTAAALGAWLQEQRMDTLVSMRPHTGPVADALPAIRRTLASLGIGLHLVQRPWEAQLFPLACAGFFPYWEKTSRKLREGLLT
ncbi:hypothetical protein BGE01nite_53770 [Brevifollis gellanilyticus]|uniref:Cryptochrome/DNA photolyase FAD-binding domain-containing protein n=1 Tax=Brevifollis gellanilyticus TaxID=748831 RepID=A0A512MH91_9BACT|nr:hypothetical protein BGE01nite_53770 [Brevifollis gellanilyticus]